MNLLELMKTRRTIRRYQQTPIGQEVLMELLDCARLAPSARNLQPLEYMLIQEEGLLEPVFQTLHWAGYIAPEGNPQDGEKPTAYVIVLVKKELENPFTKYDAGAAIENILIAAWSYGVGTCWLGAVDRKELAETLRIPETHAIDSVIALGYPAETSTAEEMGDSVKYYKDEQRNMHVPKRALKEIVHFNEWQAD